MFAGSTLGGWSRIPVFPQSLSCVMASACVGRDLRYGLRWAKVGSVIVRRQVVRTSTGLMGTVIAVQENGLVLVRLRFRDCGRVHGIESDCRGGTR
jgi:hypothetical protein